MIEFHRIDKGIKLSQLEDIEDGDALCTDDALTSTRSNKPITNYCLSHRVIVWKVALLAFITLGMFIITMVCTFSSNEHYVNDSFVVTNDNTWENNFKVESKHGVVATDDYRCSKIGADILAKGGNAMDAAIGSTICLGVVSPGSSGLGGGCFILGYDANSKSSIFIDARETAPMAAHKDMFISDSMKSQDGGLAIAVLAELKGLYKGYLEHGGGVSWTDIVTPSISHALRYTIDATLADHIQRVKTQLLSGEYPELASLFMKDKNTFKTVGDTVENIKLAKTLQKIATYGGDYLNVDMGDVLAAEIQQAGGVITSKDLKAYEPIIRDALVSNVFGHTVYGSPPPSSGGGAVIAILRMFAEFQEPGVSQGGNTLYSYR
jgi:gamma-glutamyltranspeptidase/glutathione hydrolase/leukotriene-C4 hydrolase